MSDPSGETAAYEAEATTLGDDLHDTWVGERCRWHVVYEGGGGADAPWVVILEWTQEYEVPHEAMWVTYEWHFYGSDVDDALTQAIEWCCGLLPWAPCRECDGKGRWNGAICADCAGTGLANREEEADRG